MWEKIAGRGTLGDQNWGADFTRPLSTLQKELKKLREHLGEQILLTGGGGFGSNMAVLVNAQLTKFDDKPALRVLLEKLKPKIGNRNSFTPYIDSWQISIQNKEKGKI